MSIKTDDSGAPEMADIDIDALRRGDDSAWDTFFTVWNPLIESVVCWGKWRFRAHERDEMAQDIRSELVRSMPSFRGDSSLRYFIKRICINRCIDHIRRQVREREVMSPLTYADDDGVAHDITVKADDSYDPLKRIQLHESAVAVRRLLGEVNETCATAIRLFYIDQLTYKDIGEQLGIAVNTVGSRLSKCLEKLRRLAARDPLLGEETD